LRADAAEPPEDWSGSVDIAGEDLPGVRYSITRDWQCELDDIEDFRNKLVEFD